MQRVLLKSRIHRARITHANLDYEGSLTIDPDLMDLADIREFEQVKVYNVSNGARFDTYAISGTRGLREICLNGAAARTAARGDLIIIATYAAVDEAELSQHQPTIVLVTQDNKPVLSGSALREGERGCRTENVSTKVAGN